VQGLEGSINEISIHFKSQSVAIATRGPYEIDPEEFERLVGNQPGAIDFSLRL
jgi:hypothetical protein